MTRSRGVGTDDIGDSAEIGRALRDGAAKPELVVQLGGARVTVTVEFAK